MKVPAFLKNKYVLKFLIFMAIVNVLGYIALEKFNSMALFIVMILLSRYFSKNTSINILIAIIVTSFFTLHNKMREGFKEEEKSTESSTKENLIDIKAFIFDVDGVLTDGKIYFIEKEIVRALNCKDGYALQYAAKLGYDIFIITGEKTMPLA